ncbi:VCBS repeat-containing protein [Aestuariibius sp. 2305UL40-4]|uniref:VCBS repeat-containing protein n=1 Tax=Aestuariibius violaceus TaxID=3234132 RepID=UPI00345E43DF
MGIKTSFVWGHSGGIEAAQYSDPTDIYGHAIMGRLPEARKLEILFRHDSLACRDYGTFVEAGDDHVFEDMAPRIVDLDDDRIAEIVTVRSSFTQAAQIAIYGADPAGPIGLNGEREYRLIAATPYIGQRNRWLAPAAWTDLDGDGAVEIAYVDRPHLAKVLRVWRYEGGGLREVARLEGVTNHRIGEEFISGGVRDCGGRPEMVLADADWQRIVGVTWDGAALTTRDLGAYRGRASMEAALAC